MVNNYKPSRTGGFKKPDPANVTALSKWRDRGFRLLAEEEERQHMRGPEAEDEAPEQRVEVLDLLRDARRVIVLMRKKKKP